MHDEIFADTFGGIGISKGVIKIDFASASVTEKDDKGQPKEVFRQRVVMPVEGFLRTYAMMQTMVQRLQDTGAIKPPPAATTTPPKSAKK